MNFFIKTKTVKLIAIVLIFLTLFNFIVPRIVYADGIVDAIKKGIKDALNNALFEVVKILIVGVLKFSFWLVDRPGSYDRSLVL